ncbi:adenosine deaminase [Lipomyces tetrasporus]
MSIEQFICKLPKCEQHVHLEGTLTPSLRYSCALRNKVLIPGISSLDQLKSGRYPSNYDYEEGQDGSDYLREFLANYYAAMDVLITEQDFFDLATEYFEKARSMNVKYAEIFFDPQAHTSRGISFDVVMSGLIKARDVEHKRSDGVRVQYILCFLRDISAESAAETLQLGLKYKDQIIAVGLDSDERGHPPQKFEQVFIDARKAGFRITAHCDVDQEDTHNNIDYVATKLGGPRSDAPDMAKSYVDGDIIPAYPAGADRIDHGLNAADLPELLTTIKNANLGLTLCPMGYSKHLGPERVFSKLDTLWKAGIPITLNSDDPAYMCRWKQQVVVDVQKHTGWTLHEIAQVERNAISMAWTDLEFKTKFRKEIEEVLNEFAGSS